MPAYEELLKKYAKRRKDTVMDSVAAGLSYADNVAVDFGLLEESGLIDSLSIAAPFAVIAVTEQMKVILGKKTGRAGLGDAVQRIVKTGAAMGVGALAGLAGGPVAAIPASMGTRALLAASVLLPTLSLVCAALSARRTGCALAMPAAIEKGETALLRCRVVGSRLLPGCAVFCDLAIENPLTGEARTEALRAAGSEFTLPLTAATCGQLRATVTRAAVEDWFGLGRFPVATLDRASALVTPPRAEEPDAPAFDAGQGESAGGGPRGAEPDADIRDYVPGDPVRLIHWKLSAKLDRTLIREARASGGSGLFLMLETARADCPPRAMDAAAVGFFALSGALAEAGIAHSACWYDHDSEELRWLEVKDLADWDIAEMSWLEASLPATLSTM